MEHSFVEAVAKEGRSYSKQIFENLAGILQRRALKTQGEIQQIVLFCQRVEETKAKIEAEEEGEDVRCPFLSRTSVLFILLTLSLFSLLRFEIDPGRVPGPTALHVRPPSFPLPLWFGSASVLLADADDCLARSIQSHARPRHPPFIQDDSRPLDDQVPSLVRPDRSFQPSAAQARGSRARYVAEPFLLRLHHTSYSASAAATDDAVRLAFLSADAELKQKIQSFLSDRKSRMAQPQAQMEVDGVPPA
jgi:hypothetical protein